MGSYDGTHNEGQWWGSLAPNQSNANVQAERQGQNNNYSNRPSKSTSQRPYLSLSMPGHEIKGHTRGIVGYFKENWLTLLARGILQPLLLLEIIILSWNSSGNIVFDYGNRGQAQLYRISCRETNEDSDIVVIGIRIICTYDVYPLIDLGSNLSYVTPYFALNIRVQPGQLLELFLWILLFVFLLLLLGLS